MSATPPDLDGFATSPDWNLYEGGMAVWPVGAFEQHGRHLPLMTDNLLATHFAGSLARALGAVALPVLPFGTSLEQAGFRGSITLTPELLMAIVRQMADELEAQNFTRLFIVSGHGGNFSLYPAARAINRADRKLKIFVTGVGDALSRVMLDGAVELHAGERETSIMLALHPNLVGPDRRDASPDVAGGFKQSDLNTFGFGRASVEGVWGRASRATAEQGADLVAKIETHLLDWARSGLSKLAEDARYGGPGRVGLRPMRPDDRALGMRLKTAAGWNQTEADWRLLLAQGGAGSFVAIHTGTPVGTVTTVDYGGTFCWVGMVLVDPTMRRRGIGTVLLEGALEAAPSTVRLDATPEGKALYDTLGFRDEYRLKRLACGTVPAIPATPTTPPSANRSDLRLRPARPEDLDAIAAFDLPLFGADRRPVLRHLLQESPAYAWIAEEVQDDPLLSVRTLVGWCLGRPGSNFAQIGPVMARDAAVAQALASRALTACAGRPAILDVPDSQTAFGAWLATLGFREQRPFIRMVRGGGSTYGDPSGQFAIAGPELG